MTANVNYKRAPILPGYIVIRGAQGVGKTSLAAALLRNDYRYHRAYRLGLARDQVTRYRAAGGKQLHLADHLYYSNLRIELGTRRHPAETWFVEAHELALPNTEGYPYIYIPAGSMIHLQEADIQFFCRDFKETCNYVVALFKYVRHNRLTIIFDVQQDSRLDLALRSLETDIYHVLGKSDRHRWLWWGHKTVWRYLHLYPQVLAAQAELAAAGIKRDCGGIRMERYTHNGVIHRHYDSYSGEAYFLAGIEDSDYCFRAHPPAELSPAAIAAYVAAHPLVKPEAARKTAHALTRRGS